MGDITALEQLNVLVVFVGVFSLLFAGKTIIDLILWYKRTFGVKTKIDTDKEEREKRLKNDETRISTLEEHDSWQYEKMENMSNTLEKIDKRLLDMEISNMRREILDMACTISTRVYTKEHFSRIFGIYDSYERILEENGMENGQVEISMQTIRDAYKDRLEKGEF